MNAYEISWPFPFSFAKSEAYQNEAYSNSSNKIAESITIAPAVQTHIIDGPTPHTHEATIALLTNVRPSPCQQDNHLSFNSFIYLISNAKHVRVAVAIV